MRRPAARGLIASLVAVAVLLLVGLAPLHLVAYGQTAGPLPKPTFAPDVLALVKAQPPPLQTAVAGDPPSTCDAVAGTVTSSSGVSASVQCSDGGVLAIAAPPEAIQGGGTLAVVMVGEVLGAQHDCSGADQLPILGAQHFLSAWLRPGQAPATSLNGTATIKLPISSQILGMAGGSASRLLILHSLPDGTVMPVAAAFSASATTATFQASLLGDFYAVAVPSGLPASYNGTVGAIDFQNHRFTLSSANGQTRVQSYDREGGTVVEHQDGSAASFDEVGTAKSVRVNGLPAPSNCSASGTVVAKSIVVSNRAAGISQLPVQLPGPLPRQLPATGAGAGS